MVLTKEDLIGPYGFIPMPWDEDGQLQEAVLRHDVATLSQTDLAGLYAFDSTGEFFTVELAEFKRAVDVILDAAEIPVQINSAWVNQQGAIDRAAYASAQGADGIRFTFPFWEEVTVDEAIEFAKRIETAADPAPLIHYNIPRAKRLFGAAEYARLVKEVPGVIGTKLALDERATMEVLQDVPELQHFVGEHHFVAMMAAGGDGGYTWLGTMNPELMVEWYESIINDQWARAMEIQTMVWDYRKMTYEEFDVHTDAGYNKIDAALNPDLETGIAVRSPYSSGSAADLTVAREWIAEHYSELI